MITGPLRYLRRPFESNVVQGTRVLIVTDTAQDERVWQAIMSILSDLGADTTLTMFDPRPADYFEPPREVSSAIAESELFVLVASTSMLHSPSVMSALNAGGSCICMDGGLRLEHFQDGGVTADYHEIRRISHYVGANVYGADADAVRVTSPYGTDITYSVKDRIFMTPLPDENWDPFKIRQNISRGGRPGRKVILYPAGEFNVAPVEGSADGVCVVDLSMHKLGRLTEPIELTVAKGRITRIEGGSSAHRLRDHLDRYGDENALNFPAEASLGINRSAQVIGIQREDKNIFGAIHFGLGTNVDVGGSILSKIHMDGVVLQPTVTVDGSVRVRDGRFQVPLDRLTYGIVD